MGRKLQIKRGLKAQLPALAPGELGLTTDEGKVYVGNGGNVALARADEVPKTAADVGASPTGHKHGKGDITDFPASLPPSSHAHGGLTNDGKVGETANLPLFTGAGGAVGTKTVAEAKAALGYCGTVGPVTVTVPLNWAGTGPWTQTVPVAGVTAADDGLVIYPVDMADDAARKLYAKAYGCLAAECDTVAGGIVITCRDGKPEVAFQVVVKGVR